MCDIYIVFISLEISQSFFARLYQPKFFYNVYWAISALFSIEAGFFPVHYNIVCLRVVMYLLEELINYDTNKHIYKNRLVENMFKSLNRRLP